MTLKQRSALYASSGPSLIHYAVDVENYSLTKQGSVKLPSNVQYAWPHASKPVIYAATSSRVNRDNLGTEHYVCAVKIGEDGELPVHGEPARLPGRPVHITTDVPSRHVLVALNRPENRVLVFRLEADGTVGMEVPQRADLDTGFFTHQVRISPDNRLAIVVTRGNPGPKGETKQKDTGALKVFEYRDGVLGKQVSIDGGDGYHYGARHLDFHPTEPWVYVSLETQNKMIVHKREGDALSAKPLYSLDILAHPGKPVAQRQCAGTVHFHPDGRACYGVNRPLFHDREVMLDPDNTFAVYAVDARTGAPRLIQHIDSAGMCPRTFSIDPSGRMLVAGNSETLQTQQKEDGPVETVPANLGVFKILEDGRLEFVRKVDLESKGSLFWMGFVRY